MPLHLLGQPLGVEIIGGGIYSVLALLIKSLALQQQLHQCPILQVHSVFYPNWDTSAGWSYLFSVCKQRLDIQKNARNSAC